MPWKCNHVPFLLLTYMCHCQQYNRHGKLLLYKCNIAFHLLLHYTCCCQLSETHTSFHVKCQILLSHIIKFGFSWQIFLHVPNIKFHRNLFGGIHADRQTDMTKLRGTFCAYVNAPKNFTRIKFYIPNCTLCPKSNCHIHWCTRQPCKLSSCTQHIKYED